jgi:CRISPR-associated protein (TIGR02584 family)
MNDPQSSAAGVSVGLPRRVLLVLSGLNPQVVTETVYALAVKRQPPFVPDEVHVVSTEAGAVLARRALTGVGNQLASLCVDYDLPEITLTDRHIHVVSDGDGRPLVDIRTPADNEVAADYITELVRKFTADDGSVLHVSMAGGRKTQGFYMGYALSLFGRPHDELSHVLVAGPFEGLQAFYYPPRLSRVVKLSDGREVDLSTAEVSLASIPFVRLRHGLSQGLLVGSATFKETVDAARQLLEPPRLVLDLLNQRVRAGRTVVHLNERELAFLSVFAKRVLNDQPAVAPPGKYVNDEEWATWLDDEQQLCKPREDRRRFDANAPKPTMTGENWSVIKTRLHKALKTALGPGAGPYLIQRISVRPTKCFGLSLPASAVSYGDLS